MIRKSFRIATGAAVLITAGCPTRDISQLDTSPVVEVAKPIQVKTNRQVDILFVIDNSTSMSEEQNSLASNFPKFINVLNSVQGGLPDVHIGVVSSDVGISPFADDQCQGTGDHGLLQNTPRTAGCPVPTDRWISDVAAGTADGGLRVQNYPGGSANLGNVFSCIAKLGTPGCGFEQHLESMKEALDTSNPENTGFLRKDAYLAVVIMGDEDDCSASDTQLFNPDPGLDHVGSAYGPKESFRCTEFGITCDGMPLSETVAQDYMTCTPRGDSYLWHPQHYYDFLRTLKGDPNLLIGAVIAGNPTPVGVTLDEMARPELKHSCSSANGVADPAVRLKYFADQFGRNGTFVSICQADLSDALTKVAQLLAKVISTPCLDPGVSATDIDPTAPGLQIQCQVSDVTGAGTNAETETVVPRCAMTNATTPDRTVLPCWWSAVDPATCPNSISPTHLALHVERANDTVDVTEIARCVTSD